jgi:hypothetical protein
MPRISRDIFGEKVFENFVQNIASQHLNITMLQLAPVIPDALLIKLLGSCKRLEHLVIDGGGNDRLLKAICTMECAPRLKSIILRGSARITNEAVTALARACPNLEHVNLSWAVLVGKDSVQALSESCPNLHSLILDSTAVGDDALPYFAHLKKLKVLNLSGTSIKPEAFMRCVLEWPKTIEALGIPGGNHYVDAIIQAKIPVKHLFLSGHGQSDEGLQALIKANVPIETLGINFGRNRHLEEYGHLLEQLPLRHLFITSVQLKEFLDKHPKLVQWCKDTYHYMQAQIHEEARFQHLLEQFHTSLSEWDASKKLYKHIAEG